MRRWCAVERGGKPSNVVRGRPRERGPKEASGGVCREKGTGQLHRMLMRMERTKDRGALAEGGNTEITDKRGNRVLGRWEDDTCHYHSELRKGEGDVRASEGCLNMGVLKESKACSRTFKVYLAKNINLNEAPTSQKVVRALQDRSWGWALLDKRWTQSQNTIWSTGA